LTEHGRRPRAGPPRTRDVHRTAMRTWLPRVPRGAQDSRRLYCDHMCA